MNKELTKKLSSGHSTCAGCGIPAIVRTVLDEIKDPVVVANATGCLEVTSTLYPYSAWKVPYIHNAFENAAATISGVETAYRVLRKKGKIPGQARDGSTKRTKFVVFGGDGGTYDIGLQSLSGALERGHNFLYVCYDNQGYMNTGGQRSSASPYGANTQTTPPSKIDIGNEIFCKDIMKIVSAHGIKYLAQANVAYLEDLRRKVKKALAVKGPSFLLVLQPCTNEWKFPSSQYVYYGKMAMETNFWPLYEIEDGKYILNNEIKERKPIEDFLKGQGRFKHLFAPKNKKTIERIQMMVDKKYGELKCLTGNKGCQCDLEK
ncbi:MAG: pyruvate ferredoxin oxidoreductase [Candidatus Moranbacteria bacterium CG10_big_fil_rev_8_21_14_0_10_35_21]|nr:MAG: pyruvate ferredoxin oxidoreductase [Candidatus Moranbacteria bacterium CG10_big_fil_rev_8_21_14_0_10_35_21]PJA88932.1 MAG: pyruvate ferredoxin oxidoreductase [Candidatus Moranbacteria bacterium CG_4_9_14_3_um_filter_36_9]